MCVIFLCLLVGSLLGCEFGGVVLVVEVSGGVWVVGFVFWFCGD